MRKTFSIEKNMMRRTNFKTPVLILLALCIDNNLALMPFPVKPFPVDFATLPSTWPDVYTSYCDTQCKNGVREINDEEKTCKSIPCELCACDVNCVSRGTCCPSFYYNYNGSNTRHDVATIFKQMKIHDAFNRAHCKGYTDSGGVTLKFLMVSRCPDKKREEGLRLKNIRQKCEKEPDSWFLVTYFYHYETRLVFSNIYCAMCNGLNPYPGIPDTGRLRQIRPKGVLPLLKFRCKFLERLYHVTSYVQLYNLVNIVPGCELNFNIAAKNIIPCQTFATPTPFADCPSDSNEAFREMCNNLPPVPALRFGGAKNIFCFFCHNHTLAKGPCSHSHTEPVFKLLFSHYDRESKKDERQICGENQHSKNNNGCLSVSCTAGKVAINNFLYCSTAVSIISGLSYHFILILRPDPHSQRYSFNVLGDSINQTLFGVLFRSSSIYSIRELTCFFDDYTSENQKEIEIEGHILSNISDSRDDYEIKAVNLFLTLNNVQTSSSNGDQLNISMRTQCLGKELCDVYRLQSKPKNCTISKQMFMFGTKVPAKDTPLEISPSLLCPYVTIVVDEPPNVVNESLHVSLKIDNQKILITWDINNMFYKEGEIQICLPFYRRLVNELVKDYSFYDKISIINYDKISIINYYLDIVCILVSCGFLSASIVTYLLFPSLRSVPGLNTMCLCFSLLTAQMSLLVTSVFGTRGFLREKHCVIHAVILHYSWVASFIWMNTCCIHMYRVFKGVINTSKMKHFMWNCFYSFGVPLVLVISMIIVTSVSTNGKSMAYDKHTCFLDTSTSILILSMGILFPLFFTELLNGVLFAMTVRHIVGVKRLTKELKSKKGVITYVKLSTVTGLSILLTAVAIQFNIPVLSLVASPFAGLQGAFIFFSFTANTRVLKLYADLILRTKLNFQSTQPNVDVSKSVESDKDKCQKH